MDTELNDLFTQAQEFQRGGQFEQALALYQQLTAKDPTHQDSLHCIGLLYAQTGAFEQALNYLRQADALKSDASIHNNLGNTYKLNNQTEEAIAQYLKAITLKPDYAQAHNNLANIYAHQNQYQQALHHYIKATHAAPDFTAAHFNLGLLLLKHHELEAAKTQFTNVLSLNPEAIEPMFYLGVLHLENNALTEAEHFFEEVLTQDKDHVQALTNLGVIALKNHQDQRAINYFTHALALDNEEQDARNNLAATFMHHDRFENALMHYDVLLKKNPDNSEYHYNSGVAQMALGHLNEALIHFEHLIQLNPYHAPTLNNMAAVYLKLEQKETAKDYLERALKINPDDHISRHMLHALLGIKNGVHVPEYAHNLFNNYALYYEQHLQGALRYTVPTHIARTLHDLHVLEVHNTLDVGCGTGLTGVVLRELSQHLIGIDIAEKMLVHADKKGIYDQLIHSEIIEFLRHSEASFDLIVAADVLPYFGNLDEFFSLISAHLSNNSYFIFTTEQSNDCSWQLEPSARFSHTPHYIKQLAEHCSLVLIHQEIIPGRLQDNLPVPIQLYTVKKEPR